MVEISNIFLDLRPKTFKGGRGGLQGPQIPQLYHTLPTAVGK